MGINNLVTKLNYIIKYHIVYSYYFIKKSENCQTNIFILFSIVDPIRSKNKKNILV